MAAIKQPIIQNEIHGIYTAGSPTDRPRGTASKCENLRVMPGSWLRLRGGRKAQYLIPAGGECQQIHPFRIPDLPGSTNQLAQIKYGTTPKWTWFSLDTYVIDPFGIETIATANDSAWSASNPAAVCNLYDRPMFYNGLGVRDGTNSRPAFSTYYNGVLRYAGLDAFCPGGTRPTVAFVGGTGFNEVLERVRIFAGLYNSATDHYSNAVYCGEITGTAEVTGTITVSNLDRLKPAYHNSTEQNELFYVFYATLDGDAYSVPYIVMNSTLTGPLTAAISGTTKSLSVTGSYTNGWALDVTKQAPYGNHPPRPMRSVAFVNGRVYGVPMAGGSGSAVAMPTPYDAGQLRSDFTYQPSDRDKSGVVWSNSYSDAYSQAHPGDPLQCWMLTSFAAAPNGTTPTLVAPSQDGRRAIVGTPSAMYYLTEEADGIHEWYTISEIHGITNPRAFVTTRYGQAWVDQHNQLVMIPKGSVEVQVLSRHYQTQITGTVTCCDYLYDPPNEVDRIEVFLSGGVSVCHDFAVGGEAYTCTGKDFTAAKTVTDAAGRRHHILAKTGFFTQEAQPSTGLTPTTDESYLRVTNAAITAGDETLTSATAAFVVGDVGRQVNVYGAGAAGATLSTTIASRTSATEVELAAAASTTVSGAVMEMSRAAAADISGEYHRNWDDFGDSTARKELDSIQILGDGTVSAALANASPVAMEVYLDYNQVTSANKKTATVAKTEQAYKDSGNNATDAMFRGVFSGAHSFWMKFVYRISGHSADDASFANHINQASQGDLAKNFYGSILKLLFQFKGTVNRP